MILAELADKVFGKGPDRVVINDEGEALPWSRAHQIHNILPDVIFVRKDGWCLGAPISLEKTAFKMWADEWVYYARRPDVKLLPISEHPFYENRKSA